MPRRAADLIVDCLAAHGVDRVFCVPGESYLAVLDALHDSNAIQTIVCRHESGAGFMAVGDAKVTGRPGAFRRPLRRIQPVSRSRSMVPFEVATPRISSISARVTGW